LKSLKRIVENNAHLDISDRRTFENELRPLRDFILSNVFENPTFSHEFFVCNSGFTTTLPDGAEMHVSRNTIIVVNYLECNRSEPCFSSQDEMGSLLSRHTTEGFTTDKQVASFGGSLKNESNNKSRICPGRTFSLFEQMIILTVLLNQYDISFNQVDCASDDAHFPVHSRVNKGTISLKGKVNHCENTTGCKSTWLYDYSVSKAPKPLTETESKAKLKMG
jgi:hypothetical protein